jgi:Ca2+-binding EF-hand superfamily protein
MRIGPWNFWRLGVIPPRCNEKNLTGEFPMHARLMLGLVLAVGGIAVLSPVVMAKDIKVNAALMKTLDPDKDGTVSLAEAKAAGAAEFKKLNTDKDDTVDLKELSGRVSEADFKAADPDNDGTLSKDEYAALIEKLFKAADPDNDGTLSKAELKSAAGQKLLALIS